MDKPEDKVGRIGFRRLLNYGKLIGMNDVHEVDAIFGSIDLKSKYYLSFEEVWHWFSVAAHELNDAMLESASKAKSSSKSGNKSCMKILT